MDGCLVFAEQFIQRGWGSRVQSPALTGPGFGSLMERGLCVGVLSVCLLLLVWTVFIRKRLNRKNQVEAFKHSLVLKDEREPQAKGTCFILDGQPKIRNRKRRSGTCLEFQHPGGGGGKIGKVIPSRLESLRSARATRDCSEKLKASRDEEKKKT